MSPTVLTWTVAALATAGVIVRPFSWPEAVWAVLGAVTLVALGLIGPEAAWAGILKGADVYLFLTGMMLLAETARREGLFDWLAAAATRRAAGSPHRLFLLVYAVGAVVTVVLSNDATAVVLTPAVAAAVRTAEVKDPLPYLFVCALVANAASFVLPISNPANLVIYGSRMPPLLVWLPRFAIPSALSIAVTYGALRFLMRHTLAADRVAVEVPAATLPVAGRVAAAGLAGTAVALLVASGLDLPLGLPTAACGALTSLAVLPVGRASPWAVVRGVSWGVLPLVAGLFVLVEALAQTGVIRLLAGLLGEAAARTEAGTAWGAGLAVAFGSNLVNNLPAGLIAGGALEAAHGPDRVTSAVLIGVDLGPNLSVTGSLATILWLGVLRREGLRVGASRFLLVGFAVMPPALLAALAGLVVGA